MEDQQSIPVYMQNSIDLEPDETLVLMRQKHWFVFRDPFLLGIFVPFLLIFITFLLSNSELNLPVFLSNTVAQYFLYGAPTFFILGLVMFSWKWYLWRRTYYIVTSKRIAIIRQNNLFSSDVHQMALDKTQDVISNVPGLQAALYGFGDVSVQASSSTAILVFKTVGKPHEVQKRVMEAIKKYVS